MSDTGLWLVVPVRSFRTGKRRLALALDVVQRTALVRWLLARTLDQAGEFPGAAQTLVVTPCREVREWVTSRGIRVLEESGRRGLNGALRQAQARIVALGASRMLVVPSDLPLLQADDLRHFADAASGATLALAPDRTGQGTNALCFPADLPFEFAFGSDSFARHRERARRLSLNTVTVRRRGLAFDVDLPRDLSELHELMSEASGHENRRE